MTGFSSPAVMLRRIAYGDYDLIITFFTRHQGKITAIAKSAKKSKKRFPGILEPFSILDVVCSPGRGKGMPVLQEAVLTDPFARIRMDIEKTGYASYWAEIVNEWMEECQEHEDIFALLCHVLSQLDLAHIPEADLSILFQMRFLAISGLVPNLSSCGGCRKVIEGAPQADFGFDLSRGSLVCSNCDGGRSDRLRLSKGTIKQLLWVQKMPLAAAARIKFSPMAQREGLALLEAFVPYHLGKVPKSLKVLRQVRNRPIPGH